MMNCVWVVKQESREQYIETMEKLVRAGAEGIILGCTEIELLVHDGDSEVPLFPPQSFMPLLQWSMHLPKSSN